MFSARLLSKCGLLLLAMVAAGSWCRAADLILTDNRVFPGQIWLSRAGAPETVLHRREATVNQAFPKAAMKIGAVAVTPDGKLYYASGLDGYVLHLLDGRNEILSFEFPGQVRDLADTDEEHTVYFSVVPTPQNGEPLADGKIYRRDIWAGAPSEAATVRQAEVGGNWWGTFAIRDGIIYLATLENPSRILKVTSAGPEPAFTAAGFKIDGLAVGRDGAFYFTDGTDNVYRTLDFTNVDSVFHGSRKFSDVAVQGE